MKPVYIVLIIGLILLYFVNAALKIDLFTWEMLIHSGIRFFTGFIILGIGCLYARKIQLKISLILVLALVLADDIFDYFRHVQTFSMEYMLHGVFMLVWGCAAGYFSMKAWRHRNNL